MPCVCVCVCGGGGEGETRILCIKQVDKSNITGLKKDYEVDVLSVSPSPEQIRELWVV